MKYADGIEGFLAVFGPEPLSNDQIKKFYYDGTRRLTGNRFENSPFTKDANIEALESLRWVLAQAEQGFFVFTVLCGGSKGCCAFFRG